MSNESREVFSALRDFRAAPWESIPDLGLYMDQVITFIGRIYAPLYGDDVRAFLSASMINNYVKARLIPRPAGKKYSREQVALLVMIVPLKQVCSMDDIRRMLASSGESETRALYDGFCTQFTRAAAAIAMGDPIAFSPSPTALELAILASVCRAGCASALERETEQVH